MIILFRVDTGTIIGTGHLMRCLNLAEKLTQYYTNCKIIWATTNHPNNLISRIPDSDYIIQLKPDKDHIMTEDTFTWLGNIDYDIQQILSGLNNIIEYDVQSIDLLVIDHYGIDYRWESKFLGALDSHNTLLNSSILNSSKNLPIQIKKILVIDDLANRDHICDYLVDSTYISNHNQSNHNTNKTNNKYHKNQLISPETVALLGSKYVMINSAFNDYKNTNQDIYITYTFSTTFRISVSFGGADIQNITGQVLKSILQEYQSMPNVIIDIILGGLNQHRTSIMNQIKDFHNIVDPALPTGPIINLYQNLSYRDLVKLLEQTHLNIGAGGVSLYERCYLGIPSIIITLAENQLENVLNMQQDDIITYIGNLDTWSHQDLIKSINKYRANQVYWEQCCQRCKSIIDDQGCTRIINALDLQ